MYILETLSNHEGKNIKKYFIITSIFVCIICCILIIYITIQSNKLSDLKVISTYNNPIVPEGFKKIETESASWELEDNIPKGWNNGLVIEDEIGNQFVWVPVNIYDEEYNKSANEKKYYYNKDNMDHTKKDENQILKYGGFYIARYEAGISEEIRNSVKEFSSDINNVEGKPVSKKNEIPWNYISWSQAKKNSKQMYQDSKSVESNLLTKKQLGSLYYWLEKAGYNTENDSNWGNYSDVNFKFTG